MKHWLSIEEGAAPLLLSMPHSGTELLEIEPRLVSPWLARKDADWHIPELYAFGRQLGATIVRTDLSRTIIDVNRDPSGRSLYPGMATTGLCPLTTFDGESLYRNGQVPSVEEIAQRRRDYFDPYHAALSEQIYRLRERHPRVVIYDCHSIRSGIPRLFDGELPQFSIGTSDNRTCDTRLAQAVQAACAASDFTHVLNGRFKGGYIIRSHGKPDEGVHAVQMELACRGYLHEPAGTVDESQWPVAFDADYAAPLQAVLRCVLDRCLDFSVSSH